MSRRWLPALAWLAACGSGDTPPEGRCATITCPAGFSCDPVTLLCTGVGSAAPDAGPSDAPPPDARPADARPSDARPSDARPSDARPPADAAPPDARPPDAAPAALHETPASHDYGSFTLGTSSVSVPFYVTNAGGVATGPLAATSDDPSFIMSGGTCLGAPLAAGLSCTVKVKFAPTGGAGAKKATLSIAGTPGGTVTVMLSGTALTVGQVAVAPAGHSFGDWAIGATSDDAVFQLTNTGGTRTGTLGFALSDPSFAFTSNDCPSALDPGAMCSVAVHFAPVTVGLKQGTLTVSDPSGAAVAALDGTGTATLTVVAGGTGTGTISSDPGGITACAGTCTASFSVPTVNLSASVGSRSDFSGWSGAGCGGTGGCAVAMTAPQMVLATFTLTPASLSVMPASHDFGSEHLSQSSSGFDFIVTNSGGDTSGVIGASVSTSDFVVSGGTCIGYPLAGFDSTCTVTVVLDPTSPDFSNVVVGSGQQGTAALSATLTVSAAPGGSPTASVTGTAVCEGYGNPCTVGSDCCASVPCIGGATFSCHFP